MPEDQGRGTPDDADRGETSVAPRKPLAPAPARPAKGQLARRLRPNVKLSPKARALDQQFRRWAG